MLQHLRGVTDMKKNKFVVFPSHSMRNNHIRHILDPTFKFLSCVGKQENVVTPREVRDGSAFNVNPTASGQQSTLHAKRGKATEEKC